MSLSDRDRLPFEGLLTKQRRVRDVLSIYRHRATLALLWFGTLVLIVALGPILFVFVFALHPFRTILGIVVVGFLLFGQLKLWLESA